MSEYHFGTKYPTFAYRKGPECDISIKIRVFDLDLGLVKEIYNGVEISYLTQIEYYEDRICFKTLSDVHVIDLPIENDKYWTLVPEESGYYDILV